MQPRPGQQPMLRQDDPRFAQTERYARHPESAPQQRPSRQPDPRATRPRERLIQHKTDEQDAAISWDSPFPRLGGPPKKPSPPLEEVTGGMKAMNISEGGGRSRSKSMANEPRPMLSQPPQNFPPPQPRSRGPSPQREQARNFSAPFRINTPQGGQSTNPALPAHEDMSHAQAGGLVERARSRPREAQENSHYVAAQASEVARPREAERAHSGPDPEQVNNKAGRANKDSATTYSGRPSWFGPDGDPRQSYAPYGGFDYSSYEGETSMNEQNMHEQGVPDVPQIPAHLQQQRQQAPGKSGYYDARHAGAQAQQGHEAAYVQHGNIPLARPNEDYYTQESGRADETGRAYPNGYPQQYYDAQDYAQQQYSQQQMPNDQYGQDYSAGFPGQNRMSPYQQGTEGQPPRHISPNLGTQRANTASSTGSQRQPPPPIRTYSNSPNQRFPQPESPLSQSSRSPAAPVFQPVNGIITHEELAQLRTQAKTKGAEPRLQLTLAKRLIEAATVLADEGGKADPKTTRANKEKYITEAYQIIKKLALSSRPYPPAMFFLANAFGNGALGLAIDHERAFNLYHSASKLQHPESCYRTAVCCEVGAGTKKDAAKAMQFYKKAALLSDTAAMYKLGMIMLKGLLGQTRSPREAIGWLKRAADQADVENPHALHELGLLYESTDPDPTGAIIRDEAYARDLFTKAAQLGYPPSQFRLGCAYEYGSLKCPVDPRRSIAWYARAAEKGEPESELALSGWYLTGAEGILGQSDTEAYLWARKAAEKGSAKAEFAVGYYTETGIGVPQDIEEAKKWYRRAAAQGQKRAVARLAELNSKSAALPRARRNSTNEKVRGKNKDADCVIS
ncbi:hypothetical protein YB2330_004265 [Saitoella coloradoensis]